MRQRLKRVSVAMPQWSWAYVWIVKNMYKRHELSMKANGLSGKTKFHEVDLRNGRTEYHEHPDTGELVVMEVWPVSTRDGDIDYEFQVTGVFSPTACELAKINVPYGKL